MKRLLGVSKYLGYSIYAMCGLLLLVFLVPVTGWKALTVATGSMKPAIAPGSLVFIRATAPSGLNVGDVATYINPANQKQTITHRILRVASQNPRTFIFKGDANPTADPTPVVAGRVVGKVQAHVPGLGLFLEWLRSPLGLALVIIIPGLFIMLSELRNLGRLLYGQPAESGEGKLPPPSGKLQNVPQAEPKQPDVTETSRRRNLDGMRHLAMLGLVTAVVLAAAGFTLAQLRAQTSLTHNSISTGGVSPTPSPSASPDAACKTVTTGSGTSSHTSVTCMNSSTSTTTNNSNVNVSNSTYQSATSGSVPSGGSSSSSNSSQSSTSVTITSGAQ